MKVKTQQDCAAEKLKATRALEEHFENWRKLPLRSFCFAPKSLDGTKLECMSDVAKDELKMTRFMGHFH